VNPSPDDLRRHYDRLSDQALLDIKSEDLTDVARDILQQELETRGLAKPAPKADADVLERVAPQAGEALAVVAEFDNLSEARMAMDALQSASIPAAISEDGMGGYRLSAPASLEEQALALLLTPLSEEELAAQAEAAGNPDDEEE
jgi:hypothetical protein